MDPSPRVWGSTTRTIGPLVKPELKELAAAAEKERKAQEKAAHGSVRGSDAGREAKKS